LSASGGSPDRLYILPFLHQLDIPCWILDIQFYLLFPSSVGYSVLDIGYSVLPLYFFRVLTFGIKTVCYLYNREKVKNMPDSITPLKGWPANIAITLIGIAVIVDCVHDIISNNVIQFYRSAPHYLFYVLLCAVGIGLITMLVAKLIDNSERIKRILKIIDIVFFIFVAIVSIVLIVYCCFRWC